MCSHNIQHPTQLILEAFCAVVVSSPVSVAKFHNKSNLKEKAFTDGQFQATAQHGREFGVRESTETVGKIMSIHSQKRIAINSYVPIFSLPSPFYTAWDL